MPKHSLHKIRGGGWAKGEWTTTQFQTHCHLFSSSPPTPFQDKLNFYSEVVAQKSNLTFHYRVGQNTKLSKLPTTSSTTTDISTQQAMDWHLNKSVSKIHEKNIRWNKKKKSYSSKRVTFKAEF